LLTVCPVFWDWLVVCRLLVFGWFGFVGKLFWRLIPDELNPLTLDADWLLLSLLALLVLKYLDEELAKGNAGKLLLRLLPFIFVKLFPTLKLANR
jgi:hypothetical protein